MLRKRIILSLLAVLLLAPPLTFAQDFVGGLRKVSGSATILRDGQQIIAKDGIRVKMGDKLTTGSNGSMGVIFTDNTRISLGSNSEIDINEYVFQPEKGSFSFLTELVQGTASYISGTIGKLSPKSVKFKTPTAVVGVRGTSFLVKAAPKK
ncbi:MAG: FecR family protein [Candidatus Electrothrix aestuarii]|uniref:FecR family protein n=1 Tax=Candidatus Electrothrix aestuarii TaxID=3062594 RepID=A0AAU8M1B2_9BACT|nr:FecR family protein [Candidatus Electrothrix aestuarii]WPD24141.1 MAG: FecR family protein [Candidatus Electrothrix sp. GW3-3]